MRKKKASLEEFIAVGMEAYKHVDEYEAAGFGLTDDDPEETEAAVDAALANLPKLMCSDRIYRGSDGRWYHSDGRIVNREQRRRAGAR